jgi:hypothetical protein
MSREGWLLLMLLASASAPAGEGAARSIFRCSVGDTTVFSDRPCGADAEVHEMESSVNTYTPSEIEPRSSRPAAKRPRADAQAERRAADQAKRAQTCQRIEQSLRDIRSRMRAGYTASEGERLRERQTRLREQLRAARCP